jgi:hypothetical protein
MKKGLRLRFYPETVLGLFTGVMCVMTLVSHQWIEALFRVDPDQGSGLVEWLIVGGLLAVTVVMGALARAEWRRAAATAA